jgi:hypothetical protein
MKFFVMLRMQNGATPLIFADDQIHMMFFDTAKKARAAAKKSFFGDHFGFEIFKLGQGIE